MDFVLLAPGPGLISGRGERGGGGGGEGGGGGGGGRGRDSWVFWFLMCCVKNLNCGSRVKNCCAYISCDGISECGWSWVSNDLQMNPDLISLTAERICIGGEEKGQGVPSSGSSFHLDTDVPDQWCECPFINSLHCFFFFSFIITIIIIIIIIIVD